MPTSYTDQFWLIDPFSPPPTGSTLLVQTYDLVDADDDGDIGRAGGDSVDGQDVTRAYAGDTVTVRWPDGTQSTVRGTTIYLADGREVFTPIDGTVLHDARLVSTTFVSGTGVLDVDLLGPPCLVAGTQVLTPTGHKSVENLCEGDEVCAADGRVLTLRRSMCSTVSVVRQKRDETLRPIRIVAGALGAGVPKRDLLVSRQHRMVLKSTIARRMFGQSEVLVAAAKLLELPGVFVEKTLRETAYYHLLFDDHEIILAEGAETESLLLGPGLMKSLDPDALREILALFPNLVAEDALPVPARPIPSQKLTKRLLARHAKNQKPIFAAGA